ncbi:hypothetical protein MAUB1S_11825 [Mycolicibacterium aubagnense]
MASTLYLMPWSTMFPLGISSAVIGIAEGALAAALDYQRERVNSSGVAIKDDPYVMYAIGEAAADIDAARQELLANVDRIYDMVDAGHDVSFDDRAAGRRTRDPSWCGARCPPSTKSSPAAVAMPPAWTSRCSATGATHTSARPTPSTSPAPPSTHRH